MARLAGRSGSTARALDECPRCSHIYLKLIYSGFTYWYGDRDHQGLRDVHDRAQWSNYIDLRIGILDRSGLLAGSRPLRIFEIGCAEGVLLDVLRKRGHRAEGCETNRVVAAFGRRELGVDIIDEPFESAPVDLAAYDVVVSYHTFEHLSDPARVLAKAAGMLKPGGAVCLQVPVGEEEYTNRDHLHFFTHDSLRRFLAAQFAEVELVDNSYRSSAGATMGSLYGIGRRPNLDRPRE